MDHKILCLLTENKKKGINPDLEGSPSYASQEDNEDARRRRDRGAAAVAEGWLDLDRGAVSAGKRVRREPTEQKLGEEE
ncbi:hypothetical protein PR202_ga10648 [Eleusine coracana subsp. coracana]|uniref:Uncharacterized protein n=1 Tax=Eleusine coracana subsp. coracana TaxID=191504 RepID=A0AAV5C7A4_ELECO|nr:hypothetical protein PR202_ga10648 [Eleusine coracana subsp. coracana]